MLPDLFATMITTTSYGTWPPGDLRGYVQDGIVLPGNPALLNHSKQMMVQAPVFFSPEQQIILFDAMLAACDEFKYKLLHFSIESWHSHWVAKHGFDSVEKMVGRLKTRMRQALNIGRIWAEGYWSRCLFSQREIDICGEYIGRHDGCRMVPRRGRKALG